MTLSKLSLNKRPKQLNYTHPPLLWDSLFLRSSAHFILRFLSDQQELRTRAAKFSKSQRKLKNLMQLTKSEKCNTRKTFGNRLVGYQPDQRPAFLISDIWIAPCPATLWPFTVCLSVQICDLKHPLAGHSWFVEQGAYHRCKIDPLDRELAVWCHSVPVGPETQQRGIITMA